MNAEVRRALAKLADGGQVTGRRVFPHPLKYRVSDGEGRIDETSDLSNRALAIMVERKWVRVLPRAADDKFHDHPHYEITDLGRAALASRKVELNREPDTQIPVPGTEHLLGPKKRTRRSGQ